MNGPSYPIERALDAIRHRISGNPVVLLVLGSGLSGLADSVEDPVEIPFSEVPGFPDPGVEGHAGRLIFGDMEGRKVLVQAGRFHLYEGHDPEVVAAPTRIAARLGCGVVILTNAAGSVSPELAPGSILLLEDHLNLMFRNPLRGPVANGEERFPDMNTPYDPRLRALAREMAEEAGIPLRGGVYAGILGPSYETPAEIRFLRGAGADAVGMSTVPEVITARALGLRVLAFSLITNMAAGMGEETLDHSEVLEVGRAAGGRLERLIRMVLARMDP